jgi:hypothetical protein
MKVLYILILIILASLTIYFFNVNKLFYLIMLPVDLFIYLLIGINWNK